MKRMICELCEGSSFTKSEGFFVCDDCGTKYSVSEAKELLKEVDDLESNDISQNTKDDINNYFELARNNLSSNNGVEAMEYIKKILDIDITNSEAWLLKMKSIRQVATLGNLRVLEEIQAGKKAIENIHSDEEKEKMKFEVYFWYLNRAEELLNVATAQLSDTYSIKQIYQANVTISLLGSSKNTYASDLSFLQLIESVEDGAIKLIEEVDYNYIYNNTIALEKLNNIRREYGEYITSYKKRLRIYGYTVVGTTYGQSFDDRLNVIVDKVNICKQLEDEEVQRNITNYWKSHQNELQELESHKKDLEFELQNVLVDSGLTEIDERLKSLNESLENAKSTKRSFSIFDRKNINSINDEIKKLKASIMHENSLRSVKEQAINEQISALKNKIDKIDNKIKNPLKQ